MKVAILASNPESGQRELQIFFAFSVTGSLPHEWESPVIIDRYTGI